MMTVVWTAEAEARAAEESDYIAAERPEAAHRWMLGLLDAVERLEQFPLSGRAIPEFPGIPLREILYGQYRVLYRVKEDRVEVVSVVPSRRPLRLSDLTPFDDA